MITVARESRGLTQSQLSSIVPKLNQGNLSKFEKGLLEISDEALEGISIALDYPKSFFYTEPKPFFVSDIYYRKLTTSSVKKMAYLEANQEIISIAIDNLLDSVDVPEFAIPGFDIEDGYTPKDIAVKARLLFGISSGSIEDLCACLEHKGIFIVELDVDIQSFDGMSRTTSSGAIVIFINGKMPADRKRFTISHELGHIIMHIPFLDRDPKRNIENEAHRFASEFLIPSREFKKDLLGIKLRYSSLPELKKYWGVSKAALIYKAKDEKLITEDSYKSFMVILSKNGERRAERDEIQFIKPTLLSKVIDLHYNELGYTDEDIVNAIHINIKSLPLLINRPVSIFGEYKQKIHKLPLKH